MLPYIYTVPSRKNGELSHRSGNIKTIKREHSPTYLLSPQTHKLPLMYPNMYTHQETRVHTSYHREEGIANTIEILIFNNARCMTENYTYKPLFADYSFRTSYIYKLKVHILLVLYFYTRL